MKSWSRCSWNVAWLFLSLMVAQVGCRMAGVVVLPPHPAEFQSVTTLRDVRPEGQAPIGGTMVSLEWESGPSSNGVAPTIPTREQVDRAVTRLAAARLLDDRPLPYDQIRNDCEDRAVLAAAWLLRGADTREWPVGKVFLRGRLATAGGLVRWGYHVAPFVIATGAGGLRQIVVMDPAFDASAGMPLDEWASRSLPAPADQNATARILLREATAFNVDPLRGMDDQLLDRQEDIAREHLRHFLESHPGAETAGTRECLRVERFSADGSRVWFVDARRGGAHTGWYAVNAAAATTLREIADDPDRPAVSVEYHRVDLGGLRGNLLNIQRARKMDGEGGCAAAHGRSHVTIGAVAGVGFVDFRSGGRSPPLTAVFDVGADVSWAVAPHVAPGVGFHFQSQLDPAQPGDTGALGRYGQFFTRSIVDLTVAFPFAFPGGDAPGGRFLLTPRIGVPLVYSNSVSRETWPPFAAGAGPFDHLALGVLGGLSAEYRYERACVGLDLGFRAAWQVSGDSAAVNSFNLGALARVGFDL